VNARPIVAARQPSLNEIAKSAGVSVSTVSRYVNGQLALKPETEGRVVSAMGRLGYSGAARKPRPARARDGVIGLVVPQIGGMYFARIVDHIVAMAGAQGMAVLTASTLGHVRKEQDYVELMADRSVDALIYAGDHPTNPALAQLIEGGLPVIVIDEQLRDAPDVDSVLVDDYAGAYQAVAHLASLGHERIALVSGPAELRSVRERTRGYRDALVKAGLSPDDQEVLTGAFSEDSGAGALSHLMAAATPPTAVFAASDVIALGVLAGASHMGLSIPDDLSVMGFDDIPAASYVSPRLSTVRTPVDRMAAAAVSMVVERLEDAGRATRTSVVPVSLVLRESVAAPRG
jgi:LacI family transcriptional regulator